MVEHSEHERQHFDVAIVGGGPTGLAAAIALATAGVNVALIARRTPYADNRTTALLDGSVAFLQRIGVWHRCIADAAALRTMRLVDDTGRLVRSPEIRFDCGEIGLDAFGHNIENRRLVAVMEDRAAELQAIERIDDDAASVELDDFNAVIRTRDGRTVTASLLIGADGRHSLCREAAGITVNSRALEQSALTCNVSHSRPHHNISTEFHTPDGPCVFVPLPGDRSSVVWVTTPDDATRLAALDDDALSAAIERQAHSHLGHISVEAHRHVFPLAFAQPRQLASRRVILIGEAAHVFPPIGAQGLNLGFRDAAVAAEIASEAIASSRDPGDDAAMKQYEQQRRSDVLGRGTMIDLANRTLLSAFLPTQAMRAAGMQLLNSVRPLRHFVIRQALAPEPRARDQTGNK